MNQKIIFRTGILVAIVAVTIGVFAWKVNQLSQFSYSPSVTKKPIKKQNVVKNMADETVNWQTYRNEKYGFEFKYPESWFVQDDYEGGVCMKKIGEKIIIEGSEMCGISVSLSTKDNENRLTAYKWAELKKDRGGAAISYLDVGGKKAIQANDYLGNETAIIYGGNDELEIHISTPNTGDETNKKALLSDYNNILSTFKFEK